MNSANDRGCWHRFRLADSARFEHCEALLRLARFAVEGLCGAGATQSVSCRLLPVDHAVEIEVSTHAGRVLVAVFRAYALREFGDEGLVEDRIPIPTPPQLPEDAT